jgi:hypothetical protein
MSDVPFIPLQSDVHRERAPAVEGLDVLRHPEHVEYPDQVQAAEHVPIRQDLEGAVSLGEAELHVVPVQLDPHEGVRRQVFNCLHRHESFPPWSPEYRTGNHLRQLATPSPDCSTWGRDRS